MQIFTDPITSALKVFQVEGTVVARCFWDYEEKQVEVDEPVEQVAETEQPVDTANIEEEPVVSDVDLAVERHRLELEDIKSKQAERDEVLNQKYAALKSESDKKEVDVLYWVGCAGASAPRK